MRHMKRLRAACAAGIMVIALSGCVQSGPVLLENILYQAPTGTAAAVKKVTAGVSPFTDVRGVAKSLLGKRTISDDVQNDLVVQGTVSDLVTSGLKDALAAQGVSVKDEPVWDLDAGPGVRSGNELLFAGEIKNFWVETTSRPLNVQTKATVQLRVAVADGSDGKVFRTLNLNSTLSRDDIAFSFDTVERTLSEALSAALNQLLSDPEIQQRIQR